MTRKRPDPDDPSRGFFFDASGTSQVPPGEYPEPEHVKPKEGKGLGYTLYPRFEDSVGTPDLLRPAPRVPERRRWRSVAVVTLASVAAVAGAWFGSRLISRTDVPAQFASPAEDVAGEGDPGSGLEAPSGVDAAAQASRFSPRAPGSGPSASSGADSPGATKAVVSAGAPGPVSPAVAGSVAPATRTSPPVVEPGAARGTISVEVFGTPAPGDEVKQPKTDDPPPDPGSRGSNR